MRHLKILKEEPPQIMIIPMIDIIFFLLVFFMISTLYMVNLKTVDIELPKAVSAETNLHSTFFVTLDKDGNLYLEDTKITEDELIQKSVQEQKNNDKFAIVLRADDGVEYGKVIHILDRLKVSGIHRFGLAAESGESK